MQVLTVSLIWTLMLLRLNLPLLRLFQRIPSSIRKSVRLKLNLLRKSLLLIRIILNTLARLMSSKSLKCLFLRASSLLRISAMTDLKSLIRNFTRLKRLRIRARLLRLRLI